MPTLDPDNVISKDCFYRTNHCPVQHHLRNTAPKTAVAALGYLADGVPRNLDRKTTATNSNDDVDNDDGGNER